MKSDRDEARLKARFESTATFGELQIPFPLFEAVGAAETSKFLGRSTCDMCRERGRFCFSVDTVIIACPACGIENGLRTREKADIACSFCKTLLRIPSIERDRDEIHLCYTCLRFGKGAFTHDTEFGMVTWEYAVQGITHGVPGLQTSEFEHVLISADEDWYSVRVPRELLLELVRTPTFETWQGSRWLFCCKRPMTYIGEWKRAKETLLASETMESIFRRALSSDDQVEIAISCANNGVGGVYFFRCKECNNLRANWDTD